MSKVVCVVDNEKKAKTELKTEHGVAFWIETQYGNVLFDTGQTPKVLANNLSVLGLEIKKMNALVLSHAHFDHTGGIEAVLDYGLKPLIYANADVFHERFFLRDGKFEKIGFEYEKDHYEDLADVHLNDKPVEIHPNLWTTGEITIRDEPEGGDAHYIQENENFIRDPFKDDMSLVLKTAKGLVLICGCCHAGLLNTLTQVENFFSENVCAIIGGTHLMTADADLLEHVIQVLKSKYPDLHMYLNHCTGSSAINALIDQFGKKVQHFSAGSSVEFKD